MVKNITFSADEQIIKKARQRAQRENTTLNAEFRKWLGRYVKENNKTIDYFKLMADLNYAQPDRSFNRDELNER